MRFRYTLLALSVGCLCSAALVNAQTVDDPTRSAARALYAEGLRAYEQEDYAGANAKFEKAYLLVQVPTLGLAAARTLAQIGNWVEASERYLQLTRLPLSELDAAAGRLDVSAQRTAQAQAGLELEALRPRIPRLLVQLEGALPSELTLSMDQRPLPVALIGEHHPVNPGLHRILGIRGSERVEVEITLRESEHQTAVLRFAPSSVAALAAPAPKPTESGVGSLIAPAPVSGQPAPVDSPRLSTAEPWRTLRWVAVGTGGVALLIGGVAGIQALNTKQDIEESFGRLHCPPDDRSSCDSYNRHGTLATVGLTLGSVLVAGGFAMFVFAPQVAGPALSVAFDPGARTTLATVALEL